MGENGVGKHYYQGSGAAAAAMEVSTAEHGQAAAGSKCYDDDGRLKRTGTMWTASAHIITAVIGSGVLSLAWAIAQLGWVAGPAVMLLFSLVTYYTSSLLSDCYRSGDESTGKRNYTYMDAVNANLSGIKVQVCGFLQYADLVGVAIGYTIATYISMLFISTSSATMSSPHPRHCRGGEHLLDGMRNVRDWAPPGWHWEVVSGARRLVRNPGLAVDPELLWWRSRGSQSVQGEPAPEKVVRRRVMEEDKHVRRYMVALDTMFSSTWQVLQGSHPSYEFVMVPSLWVFTARGLAPGRRRV